MGSFLKSRESPTLRPDGSSLEEAEAQVGTRTLRHSRGDRTAKLQKRYAAFRTLDKFINMPKPSLACRVHLPMQTPGEVSDRSFRHPVGRLKHPHQRQRQRLNRQ